MAAPTNVWEGTVGVFEYESTHHDGAGDDDWQDGFASDYVDTDQYTDGTDALLNLIITDFSFTPKPEIIFISIPGGSTFPIGIGKRRVVASFTCHCIDNIGATKYAEEYVSDIAKFILTHHKTADNKIYLVVRREVSSGTYKYITWQNNASAYKEYLQCKLIMGDLSYVSQGHWEVEIQVQEAWI